MPLCKAFTEVHRPWSLSDPIAPVPHSPAYQKGETDTFLVLSDEITGTKHPDWKIETRYHWSQGWTTTIVYRHTATQGPMAPFVSVATIQWGTARGRKDGAVGRAGTGATGTVIGIVDYSTSWRSYHPLASEFLKSTAGDFGVREMKVPAAGGEPGKNIQFESMFWRKTFSEEYGLVWEHLRYQTRKSESEGKEKWDIRANITFDGLGRVRVGYGAEHRNDGSAGAGAGAVLPFENGEGVGVQRADRELEF